LKGNYTQKITPFLWFDGKAEEAVNLYTSLFKKFKGREYYSLWRRSALNEGKGIDRVIPTRWTRFYGDRRWPTIQIYRSDIALRELRD
jgi:predicted 3-demethylubiquinone-9 3-methyltransferase (glyoxalase superfamily)